MAFITEDSDEDSISLTSTIDSDHSSDAGFNVEQILAEDVVNGTSSYLVKWEGYPLHRCTWEPEDQFESDLPLRAWRRRKAEAARGGKPLFNVDEYNAAFEQAAEDHDARQKRREAKRKRIKGRASRTRSPGPASVRNSPVPQMAASASPVKKKGVAQMVVKSKTSSAPKAKPVAPVSAPSKTSAAAPSATTTAPQAARMPAPTPAERPSKSAGPARKTAPSVPSISMEAPAKRKKQAPPASVETSFRNLSEQNRVQSFDRNARAPDINALPLIDPTTGKRVVSGQKQPEKTVAPPAVPVAPMASMTAERRPPQPAVTNGMPDQAAAKAPISAAPTASNHPTQAGDTTQTLATQDVPASPERAPPRGPAVAVAAPAQPPARAPSRPAALRTSSRQDIHKAYGRRTPPREQRRRSPSPDSPAPPTGPLLANKRDVTCTMWASGGCSRSAAECAYAHREIPAGDKRFTCHFWRSGNRCWKAEEQCEMSHWNTGIPAPPLSEQTCFFWNQGGCDNDAATCKFAHRYTGVVAPSPKGYVDRAMLSAPVPPATRFTAAASNANFDFRAPPPPVAQQQTPIGQLSPQAPPALAQTPVVPIADPRLVDRFRPLETAQPSTAMYLDREAGPRTLETPASPVQDDESMYDDDVDVQSNHRSADGAHIRDHLNGQDDIDMPDNVSVSSEPWFPRYEEDLKLAKRSINDLDVKTCLFDRNKNHIENVFILMEEERVEEKKLLIDLFKKLNCKVWLSGENRHWDYFKSFGGFRLVVIGTHETFLGTLPGFGAFLARGKNHTFAIGVHEDWNDGPGQTAPTRVYEARRVFPHGGVTFISDDVLVYYPEKATEIIQTFLAKAKAKPAGLESSKIALRPGAAAWLGELAQSKKKEQGENFTDFRWTLLWSAVCDLCPATDYDPWQMERGVLVPKEDALLISMDPQCFPSFQGLWEKDEARATDRLVGLFAGESLMNKDRFQRFAFVYQRPDDARQEDGMTASQPGPQAVLDRVDPRGWMEKYNHIEVVTPGVCLERLRRK